MFWTQYQQSLANLRTTQISTVKENTRGKLVDSAGHVCLVVTSQKCHEQTLDGHWNVVSVVLILTSMSRQGLTRARVEAEHSTTWILDAPIPLGREPADLSMGWNQPGVGTLKKNERTMRPCPQFAKYIGWHYEDFLGSYSTVCRVRLFESCMAQTWW